MLKLNDTICTVVLNMHPTSDTTKYFIGYIIITNTEGHLLNGFFVKNGNLIYRFITIKNRPHQGYRNMGRNPIQTILKYVSNES